MPWTMPSAMNGMRTNQFDAPTSFITSISRRRANVARRIVLTMRNSDDASSTNEITTKIQRTVLVTSMRPFSASPGVSTDSTPCTVLNSFFTVSVSSAFLGTTRNDSGRSWARMLATRSGLRRKMRLNSAKASALVR